MRIILDIEANSLKKPTKIHLVVCKDIDTGTVHIFRNVTEDPNAARDFLRHTTQVVGHNIINYDLPILSRLIDWSIPIEHVVDTFVISRLVDYSREGHSIAQYGKELGLPKIEFSDWTKWSQEMEDYCVRDVEINHRLYLKFLPLLVSTDWEKSIRLEHQFQMVVNNLHDNGFSFNAKRGRDLLETVTDQLGKLDKEIKDAFPDRLRLVREVTPVYTKHGTIHRKDFRWVRNGDLSEFNGGPFCLCKWDSFNPSSHKQLVNVLSAAGWEPTDKTLTHIELLRKRVLDNDDKIKLEHLKKYGWKVNENNLSTLPTTAPSPARLLARRILYESRRRTLTEWLGLVSEDGRIHGTFQGIGAWTHRMAHQEPNMANIPNEFRTDGSRALLGKELRSLWQAPRKRLLVGVDAEGIQLRIFAHYINDQEFTDALVNGRKDEKTDPHSLNQRILGSVCKSRSAAKRFIYALLLGAGLGKLAEILGCSEGLARDALERLLERYTGFATLKRTIIPADGKRGYFVGLDGRKVHIPGDVGERRHLAMSGYLQNGEAVVMKLATTIFFDQLKDYDAILVNLVHDEWQVEVPNNVQTALTVAKLLSDSLEKAGQDLGLRCPMAGSYWNDDHKDYTIGTNWSVTH